MKRSTEKYMSEHWQSATVHVHKTVNTAIFEKCQISKAMHNIEDKIFQMDSFLAEDC